MEPTFEFEYDEGDRDLVVTEIKDVDLDPHAENEDTIDGVVIAARSTGRRWEIHVATITNWPEVKTKTCYKWVDIPFDGKVKVPYPCVWRRTCKKSWYLTIVYSGGGSLPGNIEDLIKECAKIALVPALPILLTGNVGAAVAAFLEAFKTCLIAKGVQEVSKFSAGFDTRTTCGDWQRV